MLGRTRRIHFVGVGGIGMSGIAELLANLGYEVSGSDARTSDMTARLAGLGVRIARGHDAAHVGHADVVVTSSAIQSGNPEVDEARRRGIPVIPRAEMLAELMRLRYGIAIAGAHGKTTTTSMVALVLERAGLDPTAVIGGRLSAFGSNARLGRGDYMVVEADESDRSFLKLTPAIAVITNIDHEHMESYGSWDALQQAFVDFANKVPFYGTVIACVDDGPVRALVPRMTRRVVTYGLDDSQATVTGQDMTLEAFGSRCRVVHTPVEGPATELGALHLRVPGRHNLMNALGAVAVGLEAGIPFRKIASGLEEFNGAERRFQLRGEARGVMVVDDYGHHPTEIAAVIAAARAGLDRRVVVVFQPHRYSRTRDLLEAFGEALGGADEIILTDIYSAGEAPIAGATAEAVEAVVRRTGRPVTLVKALDDLPAVVAKTARPNDLVITLGAGSIGTMPDRILEALRTGRAEAGGEGG
ncbi:MAG TPA: UDP-N-acetylmuramate--L-alanine ligase [Vicinamibacterales bacterium]|nr:UDP-N-acetylmuramate--L-alanine ligase [Vicinamibacterales bacterium]